MSSVTLAIIIVFAIIGAALLIVAVYCLMRHFSNKTNKAAFYHVPVDDSTDKQGNRRLELESLAVF